MLAWKKKIITANHLCITHTHKHSTQHTYILSPNSYLLTKFSYALLNFSVVHSLHTANHRHNQTLCRKQKIVNNI